MEQEITDLVRTFTRAEIVQELEDRGFACYDSEKTRALAEALLLDRMQFDAGEGV